MAFRASGLDRAAALRGDPEALARLWARDGAGVVAMGAGGPLLEGEGARLARLRPGDARLAGGIAEGAAFLGLEEGEGVWAARLRPEAAEAGDLRGALGLLSARDGELAATAKALLDWHARHGFCANCGAESAPAQAGWRRDCPACGAQHFPRTDPVVIMLVTRGDRALLGRSPGWPPGMFSCLAGFMEPGETVEAAVRREVEEETGVAVGAVRYVASQPWPFPSSLMMGCHGEATSEAIAVDPAEIEEALWVSRARMARILRGADDAVRAPREGAIAGWLLRMWVADALP